MTMIQLEDFVEWAKEYKDDYEELYYSYLNEGDGDANSFLIRLQNDMEEAEELFDEVIYELILELEEEDYFGTEGFNKRFA